MASFPHVIVTTNSSSTILIWETKRPLSTFYRGNFVSSQRSHFIVVTTYCEPGKLESLQCSVAKPVKQESQNTSFKSHTFARSVNEEETPGFSEMRPASPSWRQRSGMTTDQKLLFSSFLTQTRSVHTRYLRGQHTHHSQKTLPKAKLCSTYQELYNLSSSIRKPNGLISDFRNPQIKQYIRMHYTEIRLKLATWSDYKDMQLSYKPHTSVNFNRQHTTLARAVLMKNSLTKCLDFNII